MLAFTIGHLLEQYGYWAVFLAVGAESLGVPIPGRPPSSRPHSSPDPAIG